MNAIIPKKRRDGKSSFEDLIAYTSVRDDVPEDELRPDTEMNRPGFPGECFICELRLPDHRFRWKHNKLFL
ncbi:hypothetical protein, partial [Escherichia coli]|uniref:hypothetical protein n=1 Tax=Escherichia coli TaxID=562 RepID=UPI001BFC0AC6